MYILRSYWKSFGGLSPAPAALPMNLSDEVFPHSMLSIFLPRLIFSHLRRSLILQRDLRAQKKRRTSVLSDVHRLWVVYIQSPRANITNWIFASEGPYSLCVNCNHRKHYILFLCTIAAAKVQLFLHPAKYFPHILAILNLY